MTDLLNTSLELMLVGMGIVYSFLALLVVAVNAMSHVLQRYFPEASPLAPRMLSGGPDTGMAAAIAAALHRYRATHRR